MAAKPVRSTGRTPRWTEGLDLSGLLARAAEPGLVLIDAQRTITALNPPAARLLAADGVTLVGQSCDRLPASLRGVVDEVLRHGHEVRERVVARDGDTGDKGGVQVSAQLWRPRADQAPTVLLILVDLEVARELETKTARLQKLATVGTLSAGVAHEIKNALVAIKAFSELLLEKQPELEAASIVRSEVGRIDSLMRQLLNFAGPARPTFGAVRVHELLQESLKLVQHQLRSRRIEEVQLLEATADRVHGDAKQLEQAFLNLLLNAIEAMTQGGKLVVRTEVVVATEHISKFEPGRREQQVQVEIKDSGPGIAPEVAAKLFTPFVTTKDGGTGLGLAITRRIVREHYGTITLESRPGEGATFRVLLPLWRG